ncbi:MAG: Gfo/Idh/MocA family protein, partial [Armatimonadota bacterium]
MDPIRVGMIGCDLHMLYYGALMEEHDPLVLRDTGLGQSAFFYMYLHYASPTTMTAPFVGGFDIAKVWDANRVLAQDAATIFGAVICDRFEDCSEDVDLVFIPDCNGDGSGHLELATPGLERGVPTFVDKPLANNLAEASAIVDLAQTTGTPVMSLSMLRTVPHGAYFRARLQE